MNLIGATKIITCNKDFDIISDGGILFSDNEIVEIGKFSQLQQKSKIQGRFYESCVITPAFINAHTHFEFSANNLRLQYGGFGLWLDSVIAKREAIMKENHNAMKLALKETLRSGVACVGAISSNGLDLEILSQSALKVVFFNEIMGTNKQYFPTIIDDFNTRLKKSTLLENANFKPAIALHSPYSLDIELANYAIKKAIERDMLVSAHFLESKEELMWLTMQKGYFKHFFKRFFGNESAMPFYTKKSFLELLKHCDSLLVHCLYLNNDDFEIISKLNTQIISCPRSNRLLNNRYFDFLKAKDYGFPLIIATDGLSSNNTLSILDEARVALFAYPKYNLNHLAREILLSITQKPAKKLRFDNGILQKNKASDFAIFHINNIAESSQIELDFLLHAQKVQDLYINGKRIDIENI